MIGTAGEEARRFTDSTKRTGSDYKSKLLGRLICRRRKLYTGALRHTILLQLLRAKTRSGSETWTKPPLRITL